MNRSLSLRFNASTDEVKVLDEPEPYWLVEDMIDEPQEVARKEHQKHRRNSSTITQYYEVEDHFFEDDTDSSISCFTPIPSCRTGADCLSAHCDNDDDDAGTDRNVTDIGQTSVRQQSSSTDTVNIAAGSGSTTLPVVIEKKHRKSKESAMDRILKHVQESFASSPSSSSIVYSNSRIGSTTTTEADILTRQQSPSPAPSSSAAAAATTTAAAATASLSTISSATTNAPALSFVFQSSQASLSHSQPSSQATTPLSPNIGAGTIITKFEKATHPPTGTTANGTLSTPANSHSPVDKASISTASAITEACQLLDSLQDPKSKDALNGMDRFFADVKARFGIDKKNQAVGGENISYRKLSAAGKDDNCSPVDGPVTTLQSPVCGIGNNHNNNNNNNSFVCKNCASKRFIENGFVDAATSAAGANVSQNFAPPPPPPSPSVSSTNLAAQDAAASPSTPTSSSKTIVPSNQTLDTPYPHICYGCNLQFYDESGVNHSLMPRPLPFPIRVNYDKMGNCLPQGQQKKGKKDKDKKKNLFDLKKDKERKKEDKKDNFLSFLRINNTTTVTATATKTGLSPVQTSRSSSVENLQEKQTKSIRLKSSRSTIAFSKAGFEDESDEEITILKPEDQAVLLKPTLAPNPTLRRRMLDRRDSPTGDNEIDRLSVSSKASSSGNSAVSTLDDSLAIRPPGETSIIDQIRQKSTCWTRYIYYLLSFFSGLALFASACFVAVSPLPSFINGLILGSISTVAIIVMIAFLLFSRNHLVQCPKDSEPDNIGHKRIHESASIQRKKLSIGNLQIESGSYSGWVFEFIGNYEEREKNGFRSRLVFIVLQNNKLYILVPQGEMSEKRLKQITADPKTIPPFASQRVIELAFRNRDIQLLLTKNVRNQRKYCWSKKYPIQLTFSVEEGFYQHGPDPEQKEDAKLTQTNKFVFFARSCRDKEEWFWALKTVIDVRFKTPSQQGSPKGSQIQLNSTEISNSATPIDGLPDLSAIGPDNITANIEHLKYLHIRTRRMNYSTFVRENILNAEGIGPGCNGMMKQLTWFNVLMNRLAFDILNKPNWSAYIAKKLQRKLRKVRMPNFMTGLTITEIDVGDQLPKFNSIPSVPVVDDAGLWIDFDVTYSGGLTMTLETNLKKLFQDDDRPEATPSPIPGEETPFKEPSDANTTPVFPKNWCGYKYKPNGYNEECTVENDSDIDSIVTSSEDEEPENAPADPEDADTDERQRKIMRMVAKITQSEYFKKAMKINFLRQSVEGLSSTPFAITVTINELSGILTVNIPEPPTDRLWYGFRAEPTFQITTKPMVGEHEVAFSAITNFIEKKLRQEFFNYFVLPHMDDFFIPALSTNIENFVSVVP